MTMFRQGDVLIEVVEMDVRGMKEIPLNEGKAILAWGEVTGHRHRFEQDNVKMYAANDNSGRRFVVISERPATLFHEEHAPIECPPGIYEVIIQREWSDENESVQVKD